MEINKRYWLHRITGGDYATPFSTELLLNKYGNNFISIGWSDFSDENFLSDILANGAEGINRRFQEANWGLPRNRWNLWRFLCEMKPGDIVVIPAPYEFHICEIADGSVFSNETFDPSNMIDWNGAKATLKDGYFYNEENQPIDLGFYRRVNLIATNISRDKFAEQKLCSRMKIRQTNADITDIKDEIESALENFKINRPINLREIMLEELAPNVLKQINSKLNDYKLEDLIGWYMELLGARIETPSKSESPTEMGDADKVAYFDRLNLVIMVQAKKHENITDSWAVEQIKAFCQNHNYDSYQTQMWVVSTCDDYTDEAKKLANEEGVRLINGLELARMILETGLRDLPL